MHSTLKPKPKASITSLDVLVTPALLKSLRPDRDERYLLGEDVGYGYKIDLGVFDDEGGYDGDEPLTVRDLLIHAYHTGIQHGQKEERARLREVLGLEGWETRRAKQARMQKLMEQTGIYSSP